jgi:hypothetical protein
MSSLALGRTNVPMKKPSISTTTIAVLFCGRLEVVAAQSVSSPTKEIPLTHQNTLLPRTGSDEPIDTVTSNSGSILEIPQAVQGAGN